MNIFFHFFFWLWRFSFLAFGFFFLFHRRGPTEARLGLRRLFFVFVSYIFISAARPRRDSRLFNIPNASLQGLCSPSRSLSTLVIISLLFFISKFLGFGLGLFCGIVLDDQKIYLLVLTHSDYNFMCRKMTGFRVCDQ